jgi:hypothetical protein
MTSSELTQNLSERYHDILKSLDILYIDKHHPEHPKELAGLFLSSVPENYHLAKNKIMIVGRETKSWGWFDNDSKDNSLFCKNINLENFIQKSMKEHQHFLHKKLNDKNSKGRGFHNFTRAVAKKCGQNGIIYSNLFCFSWNKKLPTRCSHFEIIKKYSEQLLKVQIEILKPQIIIFANGSSSNRHRKDFFPSDVCNNSNDYTAEGITNKQLWEFDLYQKIHCFRIQHPSSFSKDSMKARKFLIEKLPDK